MRGARFLGDRKAEVTDFPDVEPGSQEVLIKVRASGMCGSDLHTYRASSSEVNTDHRPGHEPCGEVVALGPGVTSARIGDRAMIHHYLGCGTCRFCREGYHQLCSQLVRTPSITVDRHTAAMGSTWLSMNRPWFLCRTRSTTRWGR